MSNVDKYRVKDILECLKKLKQDSDETVYLQVQFANNIEILNEKTRIGAKGGVTPTQIGLPNGLYNLHTSQVLLFVKDGETRQMSALIQHSEVNTCVRKVTTIKELQQDLLAEKQKNKAAEGESLGFNKN